MVRIIEKINSDIERVDSAINDIQNKIASLEKKRKCLDLCSVVEKIGESKPFKKSKQLSYSNDRIKKALEENNICGCEWLIRMKTK